MGVRPRRDPASPLRHVDWVLVLASVAIAAFGLLMVYSATAHKPALSGGNPRLFLERQAVWLLLGLGAMVLATAVDYRVLRDLSPLVYLGTLLLLVAVLSPLGSSSKGHQAWFQVGPYQLQPSEYAKTAMVLCLAAYAAAHRGHLDARRLATVLGLAAVPLGLIYLQPDLGTSMVFLAVLMATTLVAGARPRHLMALSAIGVIAIALVLQLGLLKHYQVDRLTGFLGHGSRQGSLYNQHQAQTTIAEGGATGQGLLRGTQTNLSFVPEQHTDFIFTVVGEELGLVGSLTVLGLFGLLIWRMWRTASLARDLFGTLVCVGVLAMLAFQVFENIGMTMGIMPIAGIPLPFVSYGGSSMLASFVAVGLVLNVHMRRFS